MQVMFSAPLVGGPIGGRQLRAAFSRLVQIARKENWSQNRYL